MNGSHRMRFPVLCLAIAFLALSPIRAQCASNATETVREAINDLLDDFDDFKDSEIFRRRGESSDISVLYGRPGKKCRGSLKTLQRQAMPREDIPTRLKDSIGELWQMGRTYARGNARKAAELRQRIKVVLEE